MALRARHGRGEDADELEDGGVVALVDNGGKATADDGLELALAVKELVAVVEGEGFTESDVDLEEGLDEAGGGLEVLGIEGTASAIEAVGALDDGIDAKEGGMGARLGEINLVDLAADLFGEVGSGVDGEEEEAGVGAGEVEEVGGAGEGEEVAVEDRVLGEGEEVTGGALADLAANLFGEVGSGADGEEEEASIGASEVEEVGGAGEGEEVAVEVGVLGEGEEVTGGVMDAGRSHAVPWHGPAQNGLRAVPCAQKKFLGRAWHDQVHFLAWQA